MPTRPASPCTHARCPNLRPCPVHDQQGEREYDARRGSAAARGYDARHRRWRLLVLAAHPVCVDPDGLHPGVVRPSTVADHVVPLREWELRPTAAAAKLVDVLFMRRATTVVAAEVLRGELLGPWSIENGQGLCASCHGVKTRRENEG